jgi:hypothetical protein
MSKTRIKALRESLRLPRDIDDTELAMEFEYLLEPFFGELSDEAAAQIADLLMQLALLFESTHLSQIRRHHEVQRPLPDYDPNQLELFDPF